MALFGSNNEKVVSSDFSDHISKAYAAYGEGPIVNLKRLLGSWSGRLPDPHTSCIIQEEAYRNRIEPFLNG